MGLVLRRAKTGEPLLRAGGVWDRVEQRFRLRPDGQREKPQSVRVIDLEESQVEFTRWFATWLRALREGRPREVSLALAAGDRRGGKTFGLLLCQIALMIDVPTIDGSSTVGWVVSANYTERDEIDRTIRERVPAGWYTMRQAPQFSYRLAHGATLKNVSADDPETLKRGRVDCAFYNEAQKLPIGALTNGIYGTADKGGIALLAANPPRRQVGAWLQRLKEAIDEDQVGGVRYFEFASKDNTQIDAEARSRVSSIVHLLDPRAAKADDEGQWMPIGDRAYYAFDRRRNVVPLPDVGPPDVTAAYLKRRSGRAYQFCGGVDFNGTPHHAGVLGQLFGDPTEPTLFICDELLVDESTEDDFLDEVDERGLYAPESLLWVGDASGQWQNGKHDFESDSFKIFRRRRWHIKPPTVKKTERGEFSKNPHVEDRLGLVNRLLALGRVQVDPDRCPKLAEALKECPVAMGKFGRLRPHGLYSHVTDALGYLCYFLFAQRRVMPAGNTPRGESFPGMRAGAGFRFG